jgi:hypothetical protein
MIGSFFASCIEYGYSVIGSVWECCLVLRELQLAPFWGRLNYVRPASMPRIIKHCKRPSLRSCKRLLTPATPPCRTIRPCGISASIPLIGQLNRFLAPWLQLISCRHKTRPPSLESLGTPALSLPPRFLTPWANSHSRSSRSPRAFTVLSAGLVWNR